MSKFDIHAKTEFPEDKVPDLTVVKTSNDLVNATCPKCCGEKYITKKFFGTFRCSECKGSGRVTMSEKELKRLTTHYDRLYFDEQRENFD